MREGLSCNREHGELQPRGSELNPWQACFNLRSSPSTRRGPGWSGYPAPSGSTPHPGCIHMTATTFTCCGPERFRLSTHNREFRGPERFGYQTGISRLGYPESPICANTTAARSNRKEGRRCPTSCSTPSGVPPRPDADSGALGSTSAPCSTGRSSTAARTSASSSRTRRAAGAGSGAHRLSRASGCGSPTASTRSPSSSRSSRPSSATTRSTSSGPCSARCAASTRALEAEAELYAARERR
jgi:hypothetical protein